MRTVVWRKFKNDLSQLSSLFLLVLCQGGSSLSRERAQSIRSSRSMRSTTTRNSTRLTKSNWKSNTLMSERRNVDWRLLPLPPRKKPIGRVIPTSLTGVLDFFSAAFARTFNRRVSSPIVDRTRPRVNRCPFTNGRSVSLPARKTSSGKNESPSFF